MPSAASQDKVHALSEGGRPVFGASRSRPLTTSFTADRLGPLLTALSLAFGGAACQTVAPSRDDPRCRLTPGMTTDQLVSCGCFSASTRSSHGFSLGQGDASRPVQGVSASNYLCPLGTTVIAKVVVINGVATEIFD